MLTFDNLPSVWLQAVESFQAKQFAAAEECCQWILARAPTHALAKLMLSTLCLYRGQRRLATFHVVSAATQAHGLPIEQRLMVVDSLIELVERPMALSVLKTIDIANPGHDGFLLRIAQQFNLLGEHGASLRCLETARARGIDGFVERHARGLAHMIMGDLGQAAASFEQSISDNPRFGPAHWALSMLDLGGGAVQRIERMKSITDGGDLDSETTAYFQYALFKELDSIDETDAAWSALMAGAAARKRTIRHHREEETRTFDAIIAATGSDFLGDQANIAADRTPVFIVGMPRTGTTLLERILGNHPEIAACGELLELGAQIQWVADCSLPMSLGPRIGNVIARLDYLLLGQRYLAKTRYLGQDKPMFSDKQPMNFLFVGPVLKAIPNAKVINLRRNPVDSCFSNLKVLFGPHYYPYSYDLDDLATHFQNHDRLLRHWRSLAPDRILDVRYEDLVSEPERQADRIGRFLGLTDAAGLVDIQPSTRVSATASTVQARQPIHRRNIDGWRRYESRLRPLREKLSDLIDQY